MLHFLGGLFNFGGPLTHWALFIGFQEVEWSILAVDH